MKKIMTGVSLPEEVYNAVKRLSKIEQRNFSNMLTVLVVEAIRARKEKEDRQK